MGRTMPSYCEHGKIFDWGDFGPDQNDSTVGIEHCEECERLDERYNAVVSALRSARRRAREAQITGWKWRDRRQ